MHNRCIIIANGSILNYPRHKEEIRENDFILCADGGTRHALAMGIVPHVVLGDFDSLLPEVKSVLAETRCQFYDYPAEKDMTDTELALKYCLEKNPEEIVFIGALGTRYDHSLANILMLTGVSSKIRVKIINEYNEIMLLKEKISLRGQPGDIVSVIPLTKELIGVSTRGLKYMLRNETLYLGSSRGISNEMVGTEASVEIKEGLALVIRVWENI
ncbi:MAG: thiamine diphosphokinase [Bacillota bacterium]